MTTVSMVIGVLAAVGFALATRATMVAGAVLLQVAFTIDCVDGQLARYTRTFSKLGAWLDSVFDRGKEYVVFAGLAIGATQRLRPGRVGAGRRRAHAADHAPHARLLLRGRPARGDRPRRRRCRSSTCGTCRCAPRCPPTRRTRSWRARGGRASRSRTSWRRAACRGPGSSGASCCWRGAGSASLGRLNRSASGRWGKRIIVLPIGERFALISHHRGAVHAPRHLRRAAGLGRLRRCCGACPARVLRSVAR